MIKKNPRADLRSHHSILVLFGIIIALLFMIATTKINIESKKVIPPVDPTIDPVVVIDIPITKEIKKTVLVIPIVFILIPEHDIMEEPVIDFPEYNIGDKIEVPPKINNEPTDEISDGFGLEFKPEMKGGTEKLYKEIKYPNIARQTRIEGLVFVQFVVNKQGEVENPTIIRGIGGGCDEEVLRVIKLMKFTPGIQNGNFVKVRMQQAVRFKLQ